MHRHPEIYGKTIRKAKILRVRQLRELVHELNSYRIALETQSEDLLYTQNQLSTSEKKYHELFNLAPFCYLLLSKIGLIEEVNRAFMKMFGAQRAMLINKPFLQYIAPESQDIFHEHFRKVLKTKASQSCKLKLFSKGKTSLYVQLESNCIKDKNNGSIRICTAMFDITEHSETDKSLTRYCGSLEDIIKQRTGELQKAREQLESRIAQRRKAAKQYYQSISSLTDDCILKMNIAPGGNMTIDWTTSAFTKITGYPFKGSGDPKILEKIVNPEDSLKLRDFIDSITPGASQSVKLGIITRQGELKRINISVQPDRDHENNETIGVIGVIKDITDCEKAAAVAGTEVPEME